MWCKTNRQVNQSWLPAFWKNLQNTQEIKRTLFLIRRNRRKRVIFRGNPLFQAAYNIKTEKQTINWTYLVSFRWERLAEGKEHETKLCQASARVVCWDRCLHLPAWRRGLVVMPTTHAFEQVHGTPPLIKVGPLTSVMLELSGFVLVSIRQPPTSNWLKLSWINCLVFLGFFMLYVAWKRGLPRNFARFVLLCPIKKRSFNLLCVFDLCDVYLWKSQTTVYALHGSELLTTEDDRLRWSETLCFQFHTWKKKKTDEGGEGCQKGKTLKQKERSRTDWFMRSFPRVHVKRRQCMKLITIFFLMKSTAFLKLSELLGD